MARSPSQRAAQDNLHERYGVSSQRPSVVAVFSGLGGVDSNRVTQHLAAVEGERARVVVSQDPTRGHLLGRAQVGAHQVDIIGLERRVPEGLLARTTAQAHWDASFAEEVREHRAHAILNHVAGPGPVLEQYLALYKVALTLSEHNLRGILNEAAWTFNPAGLVAELLKPDVLDEVRQQVPPNIWTSFMMFALEGELWCVTKGHHIFGVPDLVYRTSLEDDAAPDDLTAIQDLLMNIFLYCLERKIVLAPGHTVSLGGRVLRVSDAPSEPVLARGAGATVSLELVGGSLDSTP